MIVDSHAHASPYWFEPVETLLFHMERNGVGAAVLVQHSSETDDAYLLDCAARYPGRLHAVVGPGLDDADPTARLERLAERGIAGIRLPPPTDVQPVEALWDAAARLGVAVSSLGTAEEFAGPRFAAVLAATPGLRVVLEHLGDHPGRRTITPELAALVYAAIAPHPGVLVKFHGLGETNAKAAPRHGAPFTDMVPHVLLLALDRLGPDRLMWGSDFPPVSGREGYANALDLPRAALRAHGISPAEEAQLFGGNADRVFA